MKAEMKYRALLWMGMVIVLSGCGTNSKVDDFITNYNESEVIQKPIENYSGTSTSLSEELFLEWSTTETNEGYGQYMEFSSDLLATSLQAKKRVVLVSFDEQCDNCVELDKDMSTALSRIPSDVVVMKIPFAQAQSLYKAKEQNSVIYLNADGSVKYLSDGGIRTVDNLVYYL